MSVQADPTAVAQTQTPNQPITASAEEIGWEFVQQYYTCLNNRPEKLHLFYNKSSTLCHGVETETAELYSGQTQIAGRIRQHDYQDCKVVVSQLDHQFSAGSGVLIQVLGEMSNKNRSAHKFVQTFFLAPQPKGYYILNDIFRVLKEDTDEDEVEDGQDQAEEGHAQDDQQPQDENQPPQDEETHPRGLNSVNGTHNGTYNGQPGQGLARHYDQSHSQSTSQAVQTSQYSQDNKQEYVKKEHETELRHESGDDQKKPEEYKDKREGSVSKDRGAAPTKTEQALSTKNGETPAKDRESVKDDLKDKKLKSGKGKKDSKSSASAEASSGKNGQSGQVDVQADADASPRSSATSADADAHANGQRGKADVQADADADAQTNKGSSKSDATTSSSGSRKGQAAKSANGNNTTTTMTTDQPQQPVSWAAMAAKNTPPVTKKTNLPASNKPASQHQAAQVVNSQAKPTAAMPAAPAAPAASAGSRHKEFHSAFLKNVGPSVSEPALRKALTERVGQVTHCQVESAKGCAFVDFIDESTLSKALALRNIRVGTDTVLIEERKRNSKRNGNYQRRTSSGNSSRQPPKKI